jgi:general secretion pathway protein I
MNKKICNRTKNFHLPRMSNGFTLIETLVAMMLLAISLVVILQLFSGGLRSGKMADDYTRAIFYAREKMEEYLLVDDFQEGVFEGTFDENYRWLVDIKLVKPEDEDEDENTDEEKPSMVDLFNVDVQVFWPIGGREKNFQISTLKIAEKKRDDIEYIE